MDATTPTPTTTAPSPAETGAVAPAPRRRWVTSWPVLILLLWLPGILWSLASPAFSVPDEPSHAVKAVALWHGQLSGTDEVSPDGHLTTTFQLPAVWAQASPLRECFAFHPDVPADCAPPFAGSTSVTDVTTTAGHYPPLFYALVGWGGRVSDGPNGLYLMRITSALVCALLLAATVRALARIIDVRLALAGVLVAATPIVFFLAGSVNPNGVEIASAIAVWGSLLAISRWPRHHDGPPPRQLLATLIVAGSTLALTRTLSPAFLAAIAVLVALSVPTTTLRSVLRHRSVLVAGAIVTGVAAVASIAIVTSGALASTPGRIGVDDRNPALVILGQTDSYLVEMIGVFGWLDTPAPALTQFVWLGVVLGLLALALTLGSRRSVAALAAVVAATVLVPVVVQYPSAVAQGLPWQGRYTLPIAVGIPLLAVVVLGAGALPRHLVARVAIVIVSLTGAATATAFVWTLRRYSTGAEGSLRFWSAPWQPPAGTVALAVGMAVFALATVVVTIVGRGDPDVPDGAALLDADDAG